MKTKTLMRISDAALIVLIVICFADAVLTYTALTHLDNLEEANPIIKDHVNAMPISAIIYQIFPTFMLASARVLIPRVYEDNKKAVALFFLFTLVPTAAFRGAVFYMDIVTVSKAAGALA